MASNKWDAVTWMRALADRWDGIGRNDKVNQYQETADELDRLRAVVTGCHAAIGECDGSDSDSLPETIRQIVSDLRERVEQQQAIVALLPKSTDGTTVVPNEHYWVRTSPYAVEMVLIVSIERTPNGWWCNDSHGEGYTPGDDLYGTSEAARAAGGE